MKNQESVDLILGCPLLDIFCILCLGVSINMPTREKRVNRMSQTVITSTVQNVFISLLAVVALSCNILAINELPPAL